VTQALEVDEGGTVLLADDEQALRRMAAAMLMHLGFAVLEAQDGVEAVEVFRQHQDEIRCVLCDLTMPRKNGWETIEALRGSGLTSRWFSPVGTTRQGYRKEKVRSSPRHSCINPTRWQN